MAEIGGLVHDKLKNKNSTINKDEKETGNL